MTTGLEAARAAYRRRDWVHAYEGFAAARADVSHQDTLTVDDLAALADAAWWSGRTDETLAVYEQVYRSQLDAGQTGQAARTAMDIGFLSYLRGDAVIGSGWISRARRLVRDAPDCVERGYLLTVEVDEALAEGQFEIALEKARRVQEIADLYRDHTLGALSLAGEGIALIRMGRTADGMAVLDEAMLPVLAGEVEPAFAGNLYCQMMAICHELADLPRARRWTQATEKWCAGFPVAVMFAGICRVHRAQLLAAQGLWNDAERQAELVCVELATMNTSAVAEGQYQIGEIRRLKGDLAAAEAAYGRAHGLGRDPQPGLALLRLAQGRGDAASAAIRAALAGQSPDRLGRAGLLAAQVEIALAEGDVETARQACAELGEVALIYGSGGLHLWARYAEAAVLLALGRPGEALPLLRIAARRWQRWEAPYELARVRGLLAETYAALGDADSAGRERAAAQAALRDLGAIGPRLPGGLTDREAEVLTCVASGASNREIASRLAISEKTVARHLSNIFAKIGVGSRTEAAAYAFSHGLAMGNPAHGG